MKEHTRKALRLQTFVLLVLSALLLFPMVAGAATIKEQFQVTDGVTYQDIRYADGIANQAVRTMEIDITNPYTHVKAGYPSILNKLEKTTTLASTYNGKEHQVVGAINGSFFHLGSPMNLISEDNKLVHAGEVYDGEEFFVNEPIAFGINANGKGIIDHYDLDMTFSHHGKSFTIDSTNKERSVDETILYTSFYPGGRTLTNQWGTEVVVTLPEAPSLEFGTTTTGIVHKVRKVGDDVSTSIPENGFVLSGHGEGSDNLKGIKEGDSISLSVDVDAKWKQSSFMLASGPMLVKDGKKSLTMDPYSINAKYPAPRTAVAIDKTGDKVFFVTVDGRQGGYSNGMTMSEFANYLVKLGADRALNLDGGGSTTMAVQKPGSDEATLVNSPSDGYERSVSSILMAISTKPEQVFPDVSLSHWALPAIMNLYKKGTIGGYPDGTFKPNDSITRQHAALMLTRELKLDTSNITDPGFTDVSPSDSAYRAIAAVENAGIFKGRGKGEFAKNANLTRAEMAVILQRTFEIPHARESHFPDVADSHWAAASVNALAESRITGGYPDGEFKLNNKVTRAEFSVFLTRGN